MIDICSKIESQSGLLSNINGKTKIKGKVSFWKQYLESKNAKRFVNIWLVKLGANPISFNLAIDFGTSRYRISCQYDTQFKKYGTGLLVDYQMLQDSIHTGIKTVNLGLGEFEYKNHCSKIWITAG